MRHETTVGAETPEVAAVCKRQIGENYAARMGAIYGFGALACRHRTACVQRFVDLDAHGVILPSAHNLFVTGVGRRREFGLRITYQGDFMTKRILHLNSKQLQRIALTKIAMPVPRTPEIERQLLQDGLAFHTEKWKEVPGLRKEPMRAIDPNLDPTLPGVGPVRPWDIRTINGQRHVILDVWKKKPENVPTWQYASRNKALASFRNYPPEDQDNITETGFFPGRVRTLNLDTGEPQRFTWTEVEPVLRAHSDRIRQETMDTYNQVVRAYNQRIRNIGPATTNLTVLPLQLNSLEGEVRGRVDELTAAIENKQGSAGTPTPQSILNWEKHVDDAIAGGGLEEVDFIDSVLWRYAYRYERLLADLRSNRIPMPRGASANLQANLTRVAEEALADHLFTNLRERYTERAAPGDNAIQMLIDDLQNNRVELPATSGPNLRQWLLDRAGEFVGTYRPRPGFDIAQQEILGEVPEVGLEDIPEQHIITMPVNWEQNLSSDRAAAANLTRKRDQLAQIADGMREIRQTIGNLPNGQRGQFLRSPAGQVVLDRIEELANQHLRHFMESYSPRIVDPETHQLVARYLFSRSGGEGNAFIAVILSRLYKILSTTLNQFRGGPGGEPGGEVQPAVRTPVPGAPAPAQAPQPTAKASPALRRTANGKLAVRMTRQMWEAIGKITGWPRD